LSIYLDIDLSILGTIFDDEEDEPTIPTAFGTMVDEEEEDDVDEEGEKGSGEGKGISDF
jgi:hypothetical protein